MNRSFILTLIICGLLLFGCSELLTEPKIPDWEGSIQFLMLKESVNLDSLISDSRLVSEPGEDGSMHYYLHDSLAIDTFSVGDRLTMEEVQSTFSQTVTDLETGNEVQTEVFTMDPVTIDGVSDSFRAEVGDVTMNNIPPDTTSPVLFTDVLPENLVEIITDLHNEGVVPEVAIPEYDLDPIIKFIDFSQYYNIQVATGLLRLTVLNNLPIDLGAPVTVEIHESGTGLLASTVFENPVPSGGSGVEEINLDNMNFGNMLEIRILAHINGTGSEEIPVSPDDLESPFEVIGEFQNLVISSGTAEIPGQQFTRTDSYMLDPGEANQIEAAQLNNGVLEITAENELPMDLVLNLEFTSIRGDTDNAPLVIQLNILQTGMAQMTQMLNGFELQMDLADQAIYYSAEAATSPSDGLVEILNTDAVQIDFSITSQGSAEIEFSHITGLVEPQILNESGSFELETEAEILNAEIFAGAVQVEIDNRIGGQGSIDIELLNIQESFEYEPGVNLYQIDLTGEFLNFSGAQVIDYTAVINTSSGQSMHYALTESIEIQLDITGLEFGTVTGYFFNESFSSADSVDIDSDHIIESAWIESGGLVLEFHNRMGIAASLDLIIPALIENNAEFTRELILGSDDNTQIYQFDLSNVEIQLPSSTQKIHYSIDAELLSDQLLTIDLQDSIMVDVTVTELEFTEVTGIIAPVEVEIEPVEKTIDNVPDSPGVEFSDVSMILDIESEITLPVLIDLHLEAVNPDGETAGVDVNGWNVTDSSQVIIPNAETLVNIFPEVITVTGTATVGDGEQSGSIHASQWVTGMTFVDIPLSFTVIDPQPVDSETDLVELELDDMDQVKSVTVTAEVDNGFPTGAQLLLFADYDDLIIESIDPLDVEQQNQLPFVRSITVPAEQTSTIIISADENDIDLFTSDAVFVKVWVTLQEITDNFGNAVPITITSEDSLIYRTFLTLNYMVEDI